MDCWCYCNPHNEFPQSGTFILSWTSYGPFRDNSWVYLEPYFLRNCYWLAGFRPWLPHEKSLQSPSFSIHHQCSLVHHEASSLSLLSDPKSGLRSSASAQSLSPELRVSSLFSAILLFPSGKVGNLPRCFLRALRNRRNRSSPLSLQTPVREKGLGWEPQCCVDNPLQINLPLQTFFNCQLQSQA